MYTIEPLVFPGLRRCSGRRSHKSGYLP